MEWTDIGLILGARAFGESGVVAELMTREHGRHLGLVHGGQSRKLRPVLQTGNLVQVVWRARLDEQLGSMVLEAERLGAARLLGSAAALSGLGALAAHLRLLPERDPHAGLFEAAALLVERLDDPDAAGTFFVRFELMLLAELGFGLDLSCCAATGRLDDLAYVSPKSGRAVSRAAGEPYRDRLLPLPDILRDGHDMPATAQAIAEGLATTGFFLDLHAYGPEGRRLPDERARFVAQIAARAGAAAGSSVSATFPPDPVRPD